MTLTHSSGLTYRYEFLPERRYSFISPDVEQIVGYPPTAFYEDPDFDMTIVHPADRDRLEVMDRNPARRFTLRWIARGGAIVTLEFENAPVLGAAKELVAMQGVARVADGRGLRVSKLSRREIEALQLAASGCTDGQIATVLSISRRTVEHHLAHIRAKTGTSSTKAALAVAARHGILETSH